MIINRLTLELYYFNFNVINSPTIQIEKEEGTCFSYRFHDHEVFKITNMCDVDFYRKIILNKLGLPIY
jgi:hypothetical protein